MPCVQAVHLQVATGSLTPLPAPSGAPPSGLAQSRPRYTLRRSPPHRARRLAIASLLCSTKHPGNARWTTHAVWLPRPPSGRCHPRRAVGLFLQIPPFSEAPSRPRGTGSAWTGRYHASIASPGRPCRAMSKWLFGRRLVAPRMVLPKGERSRAAAPGGTQAVVARLPGSPLSRAPASVGDLPATTRYARLTFSVWSPTIGYSPPQRA